VYRASALPLGHRRVIRTTNLLERMFGEERRRTSLTSPMLSRAKALN
jgi:transposase-like protein